MKIVLTHSELEDMLFNTVLQSHMSMMTQISIFLDQMLKLNQQHLTNQIDVKNIGRNIQARRRKNNLTQQQLAEEIGINFQNLSKIERGVHFPTFDTLEKIMKVLDLTPNELFLE